MSQSRPVSDHRDRKVTVERLRELLAVASDPDVAAALAELVRRRESDRARQAKHRENKSLRDTIDINDLQRHVTESRHVTSRDTNEINELDRNVTRGATSTLTYLRKERKKEEDSKEERKIRGARKNGFRLPDDWNPTDTDFAMAVARLNGSAKLELEKFRDYWKAQPGQRGTKLDWDATFRNWVRNAKPSVAPAAPPGSSLMERRIAETRRQLESRRLQAEGKIV